MNLVYSISIGVNMVKHINKITFELSNKISRKIKYYIIYITLHITYYIFVFKAKIIRNTNVKKPMLVIRYDL